MRGRESRWRNSERPRKHRSLMRNKKPDKNSLKSKLLIQLHLGAEKKKFLRSKSMKLRRKPQSFSWKRKEKDLNSWKIQRSQGRIRQRRGNRKRKTRIRTKRSSKSSGRLGMKSCKCLKNRRKRRSDRDKHNLNTSRSLRLNSSQLRFKRSIRKTQKNNQRHRHCWIIKKDNSTHMQRDASKNGKTRERM